MEKTKSPVFQRDELPQDRALRLGGERLLGAISAMPLRYAPFFGRLAGLWDVPEERVIRELTRATDARAWSFTLLRGLQTFEVALGDARPGERARLMRFESGVHFPKHSHRGSERVLVLEGAYADGCGHQVRAGEGQRCPKAASTSCTSSARVRASPRWSSAASTLQGPGYAGRTGSSVAWPAALVSISSSKSR